MSKTYINSQLRREVIKRANDCCEYCRLHQSDNFFTFQIDHVVAEKHSGNTEIANLGLACPVCNSHKGSDLTSIDPKSGSVTLLFNPRTQAWDDHFEIADGYIFGKTATGRTTVFLLQFNTPERVVERQSLIALGSYPCNSSV